MKDKIINWISKKCKKAKKCGDVTKASIESEFNSLTPTILESNKEIYTKSLDYALENEDIKNIAITGVYGAGKSTVWNTYVKQKGLDKVITVSLGKYEDESEGNNCKYKGEKDYSGNDSKKSEYYDRVERQIINQISSQINRENIPLSKYGFYNKMSFSRFIKTISLIIVGIFLYFFWIKKDYFFPHLSGIKEGVLFFVILLIEFILSSTLLYKFINRTNFRLSSIKIPFLGAEVSEKENKDETVLDRDINELVYILTNSKSNILVFEDLDRYDNILIYTKLRELNFLINSHLKSNNININFKFIYILKDGLFVSKNRTKFFDFILPIVPVVDSNNSEHKLIEFIDKIDYKYRPDNNVVSKLYLYIDDLRVMKNIINEYVIYSNIIDLKSFGFNDKEIQDEEITKTTNDKTNEIKTSEINETLSIEKNEVKDETITVSTENETNKDRHDINDDNNKLFGMIVFKNIFPYEFDLLQEDKGCIIEIFNNIEANRGSIIEEIEEKIREKEEDINSLSLSIEKTSFESMALEITSDLYLDESNNDLKWSEFLEKWSKNKDTEYTIRKKGSRYDFNYNEFLSKYIKSEDINEKIALITDNKYQKIDKLSKEISHLQNKKILLENSNYRDLLAEMNGNFDKMFEINSDIKNNHYFPLIRALISEGLIDETYAYYRVKYEIDKSNILEINDVLFIKNLIENKLGDINFEIKNPKEIINKLNDRDFNKKGILNSILFEYCMRNGHHDKIYKIIESSIENEGIYDLINIIAGFDITYTHYYFKEFFKENYTLLLKLAKKCFEVPNIVYPKFMSLLCLILKPEDLKAFSRDLIYLENVVDNVYGLEFNNLLDNIWEAKIKFNDLTKMSDDVEKILGIACAEVYELTPNNVKYVTSKILAREIDYGDLLNEIYYGVDDSYKGVYKYDEEKQINRIIDDKIKEYHRVMLTTKYIDKGTTYIQKYIEDNFSDFINRYVLENNQKHPYTNNEFILNNILTSNVQNKYKLLYLENNKTVIEDISKLKIIFENKDIFDMLLSTNKIGFNKENISTYWYNLVKNSKYEFLEYFNSNMKEAESTVIDEILQYNEDMCNTLINDYIIEDNMFGYMLKYANAGIEELELKLPKQRVLQLSKNNLIKINSNNMEMMLNQKYYDELLILAENKDIEDNVINELVSCGVTEELFYILINSSISDENGIALIKSMSIDILVGKIPMDRKTWILKILETELSSKNIEYIINNFVSFEHKEKFLSNLIHNNLRYLGYKELNHEFICYVLGNDEVDTDIKIQIIKEKIENKSDISYLKEYISLVKEISKIATVWDGKYPNIVTRYEREIVEELKLAGYIFIRKDGRISKKNKK